MLERSLVFFDQSLIELQVLEELLPLEAIRMESPDAIDEILDQEANLEGIHERFLEQRFDDRPCEPPCDTSRAIIA